MIVIVIVYWLPKSLVVGTLVRKVEDFDSRSSLHRRESSPPLQLLKHGSYQLQPRLGNLLKQPRRQAKGARFIGLEKKNRTLAQWLIMTLP